MAACTTLLNTSAQTPAPFHAKTSMTGIAAATESISASFDANCTTNQIDNSY